MSRLYSLNTEGLQVVQDIPTKGAAYAVYFHTDQHYLVIANSEDNNQVIHLKFLRMKSFVHAFLAVVNLLIFLLLHV